MQTSLLTVTVLAMSAAVAAQNANRLGFTAGWNTSYTDRMGGTLIEGDALNHFDDRHYQDWMLDPADPTGQTYTFTGMQFVIQDQVAGTPETFTVVGYNEDPVTPDFPDPAAPWFRSGVLNLPPLPAGANPANAITWGLTVTIAPPATPKGDKWIGVGMPQPATGTWPTDGLGMHCVFDLAAGNTGTNSLDQPGNSIVFGAQTNFACFMQTQAGVIVPPAIYAAGGTGNLRQMQIDIVADCTGGVAVTQTNQTRMLSSNPALGNPLVPLGGTTNILSGTHPDVNDVFSSTPARNDDIGFLVTESNLPNAVCLVMLAFGPPPTGSVPLNTLLPASSITRGNICVDFTSAALFVGFTNAGGIHQQMLTLNAQTRALIGSVAPIDLWYQGFVLNPAPGPLDIRATGCAIQHL